MSIQNAVDSALRTGAIVATQSAKGKERVEFQLEKNKLKREFQQQFGEGYKESEVTSAKKIWRKAAQDFANSITRDNIKQVRSYIENGAAGSPYPTVFAIGGKKGAPLMTNHQEPITFKKVEEIIKRREKEIKNDGNA